MKAILCKQFGPPDSLVVDDIEPPRPGPNDAIVAVHAAGLNFPDVLIIQDKYQLKPPLPFSPGSEMAGVVVETGERVANVKPGDRVMGVTGFGAFAERVKIEAARLLPIPAGMDDVTAAAFALTYGTSDHALRDRGALKAGETLLVLGAAGGVGLAAIEIGKALGARVIAGASSDDKLAICRVHGADATINYATEDIRERIKVLTEGAGIDVACDPVGGSLAEPVIRSMKPRGRFVVIGFASGEIPKIPLNLPLLKECDIVGVFWGNFARREPRVYADSVRQLETWFAEGRLKPHVSATFPLERAAEALNLMAARKVVGKIVLTT